MCIRDRLSAGCWAQCEAMFAALALWGLALLLKDHPVWGCILWGLAAATKLQAGLLFPLLLVFFMKGRVSIRHPVSYTHLDVYKRQTSPIARWPCSA